MQTINTILYIISYLVFFVFNWKIARYGYQRLINDGDFTSKPKQLIGAQILGALLLGIFSAIILKSSISNVFIDTKTLEVNAISLYIFTFILILFIALKQSKNAHEKFSKNSLHLSTLFFIYYFIVRAIFLFSYELWLRGGLLFETKNRIGIPLAIALNVVLYVLLHVLNSRKEILACIPFGIVVCLFCILFNAAWPAIILHICFSLVYEINFYRLNLINIKTAKS